MAVVLSLTACEDASKYLNPENGVADLGNGWKLINMKQEMVKACDKNFNPACYGKNYGFIYTYEQDNFKFGYDCKTSLFRYEVDLKYKDKDLVGVAVDKSSKLFSKGSKSGFFDTISANGKYKIPLLVHTINANNNESSEESNFFTSSIVESTIENGIDLEILIDEETFNEENWYLTKGELEDEFHKTTRDMKNKLEEENKGFQIFKSYLDKSKNYYEQIVEMENNTELNALEKFNFTNKIHNEIKKWSDDEFLKWSNLKESSEYQFEYQSILSHLSSYKQKAIDAENKAKESIENNSKEDLSCGEQGCTVSDMMYYKQTGVLKDGQKIINRFWQTSAEKDYLNAVRDLAGGYAYYTKEESGYIENNIIMPKYLEFEQNEKNRIKQKLIDDLSQHILSNVKIPPVPKIKRFTNGSLCDFKEHKEYKYKVKIGDTIIEEE